MDRRVQVIESLNFDDRSAIAFQWNPHGEPTLFWHHHWWPLVWGRKKKFFEFETIFSGFRIGGGKNFCFDFNWDVISKHSRTRLLSLKTRMKSASSVSVNWLLNDDFVSQSAVFDPAAGCLIRFLQTLKKSAGVFNMHIHFLKNRTEITRRKRLFGLLLQSKFWGSKYTRLFAFANAGQLQMEFPIFADVRMRVRKISRKAMCSFRKRIAWLKLESSDESKGRSETFSLQLR